MAHTRTQAIRQVLWVVLALNWGVALGKLGVGFSVQSLGMMADGFHSLLDGSSNIIGLVGIFLASRPPDHDHPYGHQKYEAFSALGISLLLGLTALEVVSAGIQRLTHPVIPSPNLVSVGMMGATLVINMLVTRYEKRQGQLLQSEVLLADAEHTRSDVIVSFSVLVGLAAALQGWFWVDVMVAFFIAAFILYTSYMLLRRTSTILTDSTLMHPEDIRRVVMQVPDVISCTNLRSRGMRPFLYIDLEIQLDPDLPLWKAHGIAHVVVERCKQELNAWDVVVHVEPPPPNPRPDRAEITLQNR